uniref:Transmembrane protein 180-like n=1 Tax=Saccoglossus kowalevskii TaxID=10224 RepID=A0ABM0MJB6_SACKO|nr:PREDICTED: transmembrane protein 180-like [Saccoglossus kowalevskii]
MAEIKYESLPQGKRPILSWNAVVYSATSLGSTMMNSVFQFYYVKLFLNQYKITEDWFNIVQTIYMIWNAVNDPLFGYFQDNSKMAMFQERRLSILYGAPLFALCFLLPWFPWAGYEESPNWVVGLHLLTSLCFYDALYTFVLLAQCAIFSEMSKQHDARLQLIRYAQCASLIGSSTVLWAELFSDSLHNFHMFQCYCICVACLSWMFMRYTGIHATTNYKIQGESNSPNARIQDTENSIWKLSKQIISEKNFLMFVTMNFCQVFHLAFGSNFLAMFGDALIPSEDLTPLLRQFLYGSSFIVPQVRITVQILYLLCMYHQR